MKQHFDGCIDWRIFIISFVVTLACACATLPPLPPAQPIRDFKDIAGKWEGTVYSMRLSASSPVTVIIREDGTGDTIYPQGSPFFPYSDQGHSFVKRELVEGKIRSQNTTIGETGIMTLHEGGGKRVLFYKSDNGQTKLVCEPAQK